MKRMRIYFHNVGGIKSDISSLRAAIKSSDYDIIVLIETWLNMNIPTGVLFDDHEWVVYRRDRCDGGDNRQGGGVLVAVRKIYCSMDVEIGFDDQIEQVWCKICLPNKNVFISAVYVPPMSSEEVYNRCSDNVKKVIDHKQPHDDVFVFGDFNKPELKWLPDIDDPSILRPTGPDVTFTDTLSEMGLHQICDVKVRNQLDLIFTNVVGDFGVSNAKHVLKKDCMHHRSIGMDYVVAPETSNTDENEYYNFFKADYVNLMAELRNVNWTAVCGDGDIDERVQKFYSALYHSIDKHVPKTKKKHKYTCKWMTPQLARLRNKRNRAFRSFKRSQSNIDLQRFLYLRDQYHALDSQLYKQYEHSQAKLLKTDPKAFWKIVNGRRGTSGIPKIVKYGRVTAYNSKDAADLFANFFQTVFVDKGDYKLPSGPNPCRLSELLLSEDELRKGLRELDISKGAGPDAVPNSFLKRCETELVSPLLLLFNCSLSSGIFPSSWKNAFVVPLFKSGMRSEVTNYRGICILSAIPKLFEKLVCKRIENAVHSIINPNQHGFEKGRSTSTNLVVFVNRLLNGIENGGQVDAIYTDMAKAFDRVDHGLLLRKIELAGIDGVVLQWLGSYLNGRSLTVNIGSSASYPVMATSGVPQGSHLGPLLFSIFINDLADSIDEDCCLMYADDLKVCRKINSDADAQSLQRLLNLVVEWCAVNGMALNVAKCEVISFKRQAANLTLHNYSIDGVALRRVEVVKDLGVLIDTKLTFKQHIDMVVARGKSTLYLMKTFAKGFACPHVTKTLFTALVRPLVEYCSVVWAPRSAADVQRIESIQKQFLIFALRNQQWSDRFILPPYEARLSLLRLDTLKDRRRLAALSLIHGCLSGNVNVSQLTEYFQFATPSRVTRNATIPRLRHLPLSRCDYINNGPVRRCIDIFNEYAVLYEPGISVQTFKSRISQIFFEERKAELRTRGYL